MTFSRVLWHELADEINRLPVKTRRIIKTALKRFEEDPFPGQRNQYQPGPAPHAAGRKEAGRTVDPKREKLYTLS